MGSILASGTTTTVPLKQAAPHKVHSVGPLPCFVILVHGVNDVGEAYTYQERGLCEGFNERLSRVGWDIQPATYKLPSPEDKLEPNPDAIYYRRQPSTAVTYSPVIPFYWGFREEEGADKNGRKISGMGNGLTGTGIDSARMALRTEAPSPIPPPIWRTCGRRDGIPSREP